MLVPVEMFSQGTCDNFFLPTFTFFLYRCQNLKTKFNLPPMFTKGTKCFSSFFLRHDYLIFVDSYFVLFVKMEGRSKFLFKILSPLTTVKNHAIVSDLFFFIHALTVSQYYWIKPSIYKIKLKHHKIFSNSCHKTQ